MIAFATFFAVCSIAPAGAYQQGEWVLGQWQGGAYYYPGIVAGQVNGMVTIRYDDGDVDTRPVNQVRPYDWRVGSRVECNFQRAGVWYSGTISSLGGASLAIAYDDGDFETTRTGLCRSR
ncbi:MAG: hypothetical protein VYD64_04910 [Pseudomonadota bacterium]|nr:hypothetical protein [Pseudomonadota bacterium]